jgi:hypothetical protein
MWRFAGVKLLEESVHNIKIKQYPPKAEQPATNTNTPSDPKKLDVEHKKIDKNPLNPTNIDPTATETPICATNPPPTPISMLRLVPHLAYSLSFPSDRNSTAVPVSGNPLSNHPQNNSPPINNRNSSPRIRGNSDILKQKHTVRFLGFSTEIPDYKIVLPSSATGTLTQLCQ